MKKVNYWLACFMAAAALATSFTACSSDDDPVYEPPTIGMGGSDPAGNAGTVDLSEALTFVLPVNITSEAGLASIVVKDGTGKEWLNQTSFDNPNKVDAVTLDLSSLTESTQLYLTVVATAKDGKVTTSSQYSLSISVPQLRVRMSPASTTGDKVNMTFTISRGVKALSRVDVCKGSQVIQNIPYTGEESKAKKSTKTFKVENLELGKNPITVKVYEEGMSEASAEITSDAFKIDKTKLKSFILSNAQNRYDVGLFFGDDGLDENPSEIEFDYSNQSSTSPRNDDEYIAFTYDETGKVIEMTATVETMIFNPSDPYGMPEMSSDEKTYKFIYKEGTNELEKVTLDGSDYVTDVVYGENGIESYNVSGEKIVAQYDENGIRVDFYDGSSNKFIHKDTDEPNPYYISGVPAVIPKSLSGSPMSILYNPYLYSGIEGVWTDGWTTNINPEGSYKWDDNDELIFVPTIEHTAEIPLGDGWSIMIAYLE